MIIATLILVLCALWLIAVGIVMLFNPAMATRIIGKMASTALINYTEILLRIVSGIALVLSADSARYPELFNIFGWLLILTSCALLLVPREWHARYAVYWSQQLSANTVRLCAPFSLVMGGLLIHGVF